MAGTSSDDAPKGKCPKCGSTNIWVAVAKPPRFICRKCGHQFV